MLTIQANEIKASFNQSLMKSHTHLPSSSVFRQLQYVVSSKCMELLINEFEKFGISSMGPCQCQLPITHGLPCIHTIRSHDLQDIPIQPSLVHVFWKTLSMDGATWNVGDDEGKRRVARSLMNDFIDNEFPNLSADEQH